MKRIFLILIVISMCITLTACKKTLEIKNENNIGTASFLYDLKEEYIGNNPVLGNILNKLGLDNYGKYKYEIKDNYLTISYYEVEGWGNILNNKELVIEKSALILTLIDDCNEVGWYANNKQEIITLKELNDKYGDIKGYGKSLEAFNNLLIKLNYYENSDPIQFKINELTSTGMKLNIINSTDKSYLYGDDFTIKKKDGNKWKDIEGTPEFFNAIGYTLLPNNNVEIDINWNVKLKNGIYKITKDFDEIIDESDLEMKFGKRYYISVEFSIE